MEVVKTMRTLLEGGTEPVVVGEDGGVKEGGEAVESVLQAAVEGRPLQGEIAGEEREEGDGDEEVEGEGDAEGEGEGEGMEGIEEGQGAVPQVVVVEAPTPTQTMKTRHARSPPETTDAQDGAAPSL